MRRSERTPAAALSRLPGRSKPAIRSLARRKSWQMSQVPLKTFGANSMKGTHKTPRATVDTNLVIGALITPSGIGQKLLTAFSEDAFEWIISTAAFSEIENVLTRETIQGKYRISTAKIEEALTTIAEAAVFLETPPVASLPLHS